MDAEERTTDALAARWLAWGGGVTTLVGICLLLALAISHGWIGHTGRLALAALGSAALVAAGAWLRDRLGRLEAPVAMICAGTLGWCASAVVAATTYGLIAPAIAFVAAVAAGAVATWLAVRWGSRTIGTVGLLGPLVVPWFLGSAGVGVPAIAAFTLLGGASAVMAARQRWGWLAFGALLVAEIDVTAAVSAIASHAQAVGWLTQNGTSGVNGGAAATAHLALWATLPMFVVALGIAALLQRSESAVAGEADAAESLIVCPRSRAGSAATVCAAAAAVLCAALASGQGVLDGEVPALIGHAGSTAWLGAVLAGLVALGVLAWREERVAPLLATVLALAAVVTDLILAINLHGISLTLGFGATALALTVVRRVHAQRASDRALADIGLAGHTGLVLVRLLLAAPTHALGSGSISPDAAVAAGTLVAICMAASRGRRERGDIVGIVMSALGPAAVLYVTGLTLTGAGFVAAVAGEAVALAALARRDDDPIAGLTALVFLLAAWLHTLLLEAPLTALIAGVPSIGGAAGALAAVGGATEGVRRAFYVGTDPERYGDTDRGFRVVAVLSPLYLASVAVISLFQPAVGVGLQLLDLTVRQEGQVVLSALWALSGLIALVIGLRQRWNGIRNGGLILLLVSAVKVFLYDLSTLTSIYRVVSFIALGVLLLAGALAYQRLRPPALPDIRDTTRAER